LRQELSSKVASAASIRGKAGAPGAAGEGVAAEEKRVLQLGVGDGVAEVGGIAFAKGPAGVEIERFARSGRGGGGGLKREGESEEKQGDEGEEVFHETGFAGDAAERTARGRTRALAARRGQQTERAGRRLSFDKTSGGWADRT
jgi:hypothetical protein